MQSNVFSTPPDARGGSEPDLYARVENHDGSVRARMALLPTDTTSYLALPRSAYCIPNVRSSVRPGPDLFTATIEFKFLVCRECRKSKGLRLGAFSS